MFILKCSVHFELSYWIIKKCEYQLVNLAFTQLPRSKWWKTSYKHKKSYIDVKSWNWSYCRTIFCSLENRIEIHTLRTLNCFHGKKWNIHAHVECLEWKMPTKLSSMASCCKNLQKQHTTKVRNKKTRTNSKFMCTKDQ
jgi:hypothetical protein